MKKKIWLDVILSLTIFSTPTVLLSQGAYKPVVIKDGRAQQIKDNEVLTISALKTPILNITPGNQPSSPSNGDCWMSDTGLNCYANRVISLGDTVGVSVASYGASPAATGTTNRTAFQAAIDASPSGSIIAIPGIGNYTITGTVDVGTKIIRWVSPLGATVNGSRSPELEGLWINGPEEIQFTKGLGDPNVFTLGPGSVRQLLQTGAVGHFEASHIEADARNNGVAGKFIVGIQGIGRTDSSGNIFGTAGYAQAGINTAGTAEISGGEFNVDVRSSVVTRKTGLQIFDVDTSIGYGSVFDGALLIGRQAGGVGFENGVVFGTGTDAQFPLKNGDNNALISVQSGDGTEIGHGLNLSGIKFRKSAISLRSQTLGQKIKWSVGTSTTNAGEVRSDASVEAGKIIFTNGGLVVQDGTNTTRFEVNSGGLYTDKLTTGLGVSTGGIALELGGERTGIGASYIDFHSTAGSDYESRIIRQSGTNGNLEIINSGTGSFILQTNETTRMTIDSVGKTVFLGEIQSNGILTLSSYLVANLPACVTDKKGAMAAVTDLTAITYNDTPTGGGSLSAPVYCNGTAWTIH